jgi:hypothetical protein
MSGEAIKSTAITNLDAAPPVRATAGKGGSYNPVVYDASAHITTGMDNTSTYRMVRVPSNFIVKKVEAWLDAAGTTITGDIGIWYSSNANDEVGASVGKSGVLNQDHFASAVALAAIVTPTEYTFEAGTYLAADTAKELWNTTQSTLTADPGGFIDIVFALTSTSGSAADLNLRVTGAMPYTG